MFGRWREDWKRERKKKQGTEWKMCGGMFETLPVEFSICGHGIFQCMTFLHTDVFPMTQPCRVRQRMPVHMDL
jgi:hypothetical protein